MSSLLKESLESQLTLADPGLIGCRRRNLWQSSDEPWRHIRGNSLLALVGQKDGIHTEHGPMEFFTLQDRFLLQFRAGQWNTYWMEDFLDVWSLAVAHGHDFSRMIYVLREDKGELTVHEVDVPESLDPLERARQILEEFTAEPPGRISKAGARAQRVCRYCPVRVRCNAADQLSGEMDDWSPAYQKDLR